LYRNLIRSYVEPNDTPIPVATDAALRPLPLRKNITPNNPPATAPTAVLINAIDSYFVVFLLYCCYFCIKREKKKKKGDY
jgi:hypothetical protein